MEMRKIDSDSWPSISALTAPLVEELITRRRELLPAIVLTVLTALMLQVIFEFGPLWLVASGAAPGLYGPFWAGLVSTLGLGGLVAGRVRFDHPTTLTATVAVLTLASGVLTVSRNLVVVTIAQFALALLVVAMSIYVSRVIHDAVPSTIRGPWPSETRWRRSSRRSMCSRAVG